jgi:hypothetical protein
MVDPSLLVVVVVNDDDGRGDRCMLLVTNKQEEQEAQEPPCGRGGRGGCVKPKSVPKREVAKIMFEGDGFGLRAGANANATGKMRIPTVFELGEWEPAGGHKREPRPA